MTNSAPVALIYRSQLLPPSETFIQSQAAFMKNFRPFFVGRSRVPGLELPAESVWVANQGGPLGRLQDFRFRALGPGAECRTKMQALDPKIIHGHFGSDACEAIPLASFLNVPLVVTFHGSDATRTDSALRRTRHGRRYLRQFPELRAKAELFVAVSQFIAKRVEQKGIPSDRIRLNYIGVDIEKFAPLHAANRQNQVLFVGRLVEKKGCAVLIQAMAAVQNEFPDVELVIIGDGPERQVLETEAHQSLKKYRFLGVQPSSVVQEWMQKAALLCVPSITGSDGDSEGLPIALYEAQASGLPVVASASAGIPEVVIHGETGFLAPERDWQRLSEHLVLLLKSAGLRETFSRAAREQIEKKFDIRKQTASLEGIYQEAINSHSHGTRGAKSSSVI
jgi:colanic acid/amylovoran biosynthesis glycosyltransferase